MHATLALIALVCVLAAPVTSRARRPKETQPLVDQRQEGGWNVRADLKNFVVVIVPRAGAPHSGLLELLTRGLRPPPQAHFIQSKAAPYQVDISKAGAAHLRKDEILATQSPQEAAPGRRLRAAKAFVLTVPDQEFDVTPKGGEGMSLLGAAEQCGPDMRRDALGVCRPV
uniref:Uncharacterized protein n=2 Tax=Dendroctonus ponderosae TaxID=77166 RepID=A0AAR5QKK4_DENPD